jgi:hypothetical protein
MSGPTARLLEGDALLERVEAGLQALKAEHRAMVDDPLRPQFADSIDFDEATRSGNDNSPRWDYLLGPLTNVSSGRT